MEKEEVKFSLFVDDMMLYLGMNHLKMTFRK
jgi:hypothetical protein